MRGALEQAQIKQVKPWSGKLAVTRFMAGAYRFALERWPYLALALLTIEVRWFTAPGFIESRDGLFFTRALDHYSVWEMRPQWPGYPVYIWLGGFFKLFCAGNIEALHLLSVVASSLALWPVAALATGWRRALSPGIARSEARLSGLAAALLWAVIPLAWQGGSEIFSDPLALLLGLTMLWLCWQVFTDKARSTYYLALAGVLAGLMLGVRLSYLALLLPLGHAAWSGSFSNGRFKLKPGLVTAGGLLISTGLWLGWQFAQEGFRFMEAASRHLTGHYGSWGGSVATDHNLLARPVRFFETGWVYGLGGWWPDTPWQRLPASLLLAGLLLAGLARLFSHRPASEAALAQTGPAEDALTPVSRRLPLVLAASWGLPYFFWILLGNDVDLARYSFPLVALSCIVAGLGLPAARKWSVALLVAAVLSVALVSVPLGLEHHTSEPVSLRLPAYMNASLDPASSTVIVSDAVPYLIFFTLENAPAIPSLRVTDADLGSQVAKLERQGRTVYMTALPGAAPQGWVPVANLCRARFQESRGPLAVWLYRHAPGETAQPPACY